MRPIDADALIDSLNNLEAANGNKFYRKALNDAIHDFFPQIIASEPTIPTPPNAPLTLDELREMDGEPVFVTLLDGWPHGWMLVEAQYDCVSDHRGCLRSFKSLGIVWLAYRRKLEEGI